MLFSVFFYFIPMILLSALEVLTYNRSQILYLHFIASILTLFFIGLSYHLGVDWLEYYRFYNGVSSSAENYELGYSSLNHLLFISGVNFWLFNYAVKLCFLTFLIFFFKKYCKFPTLALTFFIGIVFPFINDPLRQLIAAIFLLAPFVLFSRVPGVLSLIFGSLFHSSFVICFGLIFRKLKRRTLIFVMLSLGCFILFSTVTVSVLNVINIYPIDLIMIKLKYYMKNTEPASYVSTAIRVIFLLFICFSYKVNRANSEMMGCEKENIFWLLSFLYLTLEVSLINLPIIPQRVRLYLLPFAIVLFVNFLSRVPSVINRLCLLVIVACYCCLTLYSFVNKPVGEYYSLDNNIIIHSFLGTPVISKSKVDDFWIYQE